MNTLGAKIRAAREAKRLNQRELAERTGIDQSILSRIENGDREPSKEVAKVLARVLAPYITAEEMLDLKVEEPAAEYGKKHPARQILADYDAPAGLRALAGDKDLVQALRIAEDEWRTLRSIDLPEGVTKEGYVQLLITVRAVTGGRLGVV